MKVFITKLDNPSNEYEWWIKNIEVKTPNDLEKLAGICARHLYAEIYQVDKDDNPALVRNVEGCLSAMTTYSARGIITFLFTLINRVLDDGKC